MAKRKKGFVFYYDALEIIRPLTAEQKGYLLEALASYSLACDREETDPDAVLAQYPQLTAESAMAFAFMAERVRHDTVHWNTAAARQQKPKDSAEEKPSLRLAGTNRIKAPEDYAASLRKYLPNRRE